MVVPADSTLAAIRTKVRRLTASSSESTLTTAAIDQYINTFYNQDFPYGIKLDQTRQIYTLFTSPFVDRYPVDVNNNQGIRDPVYFEGVKGYFFKDRSQFFNMWPRWPTKFQPISGNGTKTNFSFTVSNVPILSTMVVLGGVDKNGAIIRVVDDGGTLAPNGNNTTTGSLLLLNSDTVGDFNPAIPPTSPIQSTSPNPPFNIGTINYVTGAVSINFPVAPAAGTLVTMWVTQYSAGRPYSLLFWNNEITIRPVPDNVYKVELESYMTPSQLLASTQSPVLNQWWQYIAIGAAMKVLEDRQDMEGYQNLIPLLERQEGLVLERQGVEEIGQRNTTIFSQTIYGQNFGSPSGWWP